VCPVLTLHLFLLFGTRPVGRIKSALNRMAAHLLWASGLCTLPVLSISQTRRSCPINMSSRPASTAWPSTEPFLGSFSSEIRRPEGIWSQPNQIINKTSPRIRPDAGVKSGPVFALRLAAIRRWSTFVRSHHRPSAGGAASCEMCRSSSGRPGGSAFGAYQFNVDDQDAEMLTDR
jgi:hypothetical protein